MSDGEHRLFARIAKKRGVALSEWVRTALREASQEESLVDPSKKIEAIRSAARHSFPTADIDVMLEEIERGYRA